MTVCRWWRGPIQWKIWSSLLTLTRRPTECSSRLSSNNSPSGAFSTKGWGGAAWPRNLQLIIVGDDFEHTTDGITSSTEARVQVVLPCVLE